MNQLKSYSKLQSVCLVLLRVVIGWHFLYEGLYKLVKSNWTAKHYLNDSDGILANFFQSMANSDTVMSIVDFTTVWGLVFIGLGLILGCLCRFAAIGGIVMLAMFFLSHIPFIGANYMMPFEGNYIWLDKNIIELCALLVLIVFPTSHIIGFDRIICNKSKKERK